jgi:hypothetical protein
VLLNIFNRTLPLEGSFLAFDLRRLYLSIVVLYFELQTLHFCSRPPAVFSCYIVRHMLVVCHGRAAVEAPGLVHHAWAFMTPFLLCSPLFDVVVADREVIVLLRDLC